jgi:hypothetical protein
MLKRWAILVGLTAGLAVGTSAIAGGADCASKQTQATVPSAEKSAAQSQSTTTETGKQNSAAN